MYGALATRPTKTKRKSRQVELTEAVQKLEDENFALRHQIKAGKGNGSEFTESPLDMADIELFLPSNVSSEVLQQLNGEMTRLQETFGLRCIWKTPISSNEEGDNV